jgi:hypothetical protein
VVVQVFSDAVQLVTTLTWFFSRSGPGPMPESCKSCGEPIATGREDGLAPCFDKELGFLRE